MLAVTHQISLNLSEQQVLKDSTQLKVLVVVSTKENEKHPLVN